jgi:immune inhibitor A
LTEDVVYLADPYVDFSQYDNDNDGYVDALFVIHAGPGAEHTGDPNDIWSHQWNTGYPPYVDGVYVTTYSMEPEYWSSPGDMTIGVYCHELGHVFGLPDLYDYGFDSQGVGRWSLMAVGSWNGPMGSSPAHPDAWSRWVVAKEEEEKQKVRKLKEGRGAAGGGAQEVKNRIAPLRTAQKGK